MSVADTSAGGLLTLVRTGRDLLQRVDRSTSTKTRREGLCRPSHRRTHESNNSRDVHEARGTHAAIDPSYRVPVESGCSRGSKLMMHAW